MTADPRIIKTSYVIDEMSYYEAMELCNFGAKVIYPPTLYAVCRKEIPIVVKNIFNPAAAGTVIRKRRTREDNRLICGISSIDDICLLTLSGTSMVGLVGVDSRIFSALAAESISAFMESQSASETGISIGVTRSRRPRILRHQHLPCDGSQLPAQDTQRHMIPSSSPSTGKSTFSCAGRALWAANS